MYLTVDGVSFRTAGPSFLHRDGAEGLARLYRRRERALVRYVATTLGVDAKGLRELLGGPVVDGNRWAVSYPDSRVPGVGPVFFETGPGFRDPCCLRIG